jgi:hypothetical protein
MEIGLGPVERRRELPRVFLRLKVFGYNYLRVFRDLRSLFWKTGLSMLLGQKVRLRHYQKCPPGLKQSHRGECFHGVCGLPLCGLGGWYGRAL